MTDPVFIHPIPEPVAVGDRFRLTGAEAKHASVKRLEVGEGVVVTDGTTRACKVLFWGTPPWRSLTSSTFPCRTRG